LDITFAVGGVVFAALFLVLALLLRYEYNFAKDYVHDQLGQQKIVFATADKLTDEEKNWKPGSQCLVDYAGQTMVTGKQAECYANYYIAMHMDRSAKAAGWQGETYATMGSIRTDLSAQITAAKDKGDTAGAADLQKKLDAATSLRSTFQTGETLRGLLLTSYGFSIFGDKAGQVMLVMFGLAAVMAVLSAAGFVHALVTPRDKVVGVFAARPVESKA